MSKETLHVVTSGGITTPAGFKAAGIHAGFRKNPHRRDLALIVPDKPCACAGVFTQNPFASAPVQISRRHIAGGHAAAVVINSGNANAATGEQGLRVAEQTCEVAARVIGCDPSEVLVSSTGVVGEQLDLAEFESGIPLAYIQANAETGGTDAAQAIMTTDTHSKEYAVRYVSGVAGFEGMTIAIGGMCKGSGMIMPNMATMISVLTTDAPLAPKALHAALVDSVADSFNKVTVDGDSSTNDTCLLLASGAAAGAGAPDASAPDTDAAAGAADLKTFEVGSPSYLEFLSVLNHVMQTLARMIAADGEGSTRLVTVNVTGAANDAEADMAARRVANSPLVKTAIFGHDANWGRVAVALGTSGAHFAAQDVNIDFMGLPVCRAGMTVKFDETEALRRFEAPEVVIDCDLGAGDGACTIWTCDLTYDYVRINGEYRT